MMVHIFLKRIAILFAMLGTLTLVAGCNTMEGLGEDTQAVGESLEEEAEEHAD